MMIDDFDWERDGAELDFVMKILRGSSFPPGVLDAYIARQRQRHALIQQEIDRVFREAASDPVLMARLNRPL
jgi:hypothetical protein